MTGVITIKSEDASFDRELISRHFLTVEARDDLGMGNRSVRFVIVYFHLIGFKSQCYITECLAEIFQEHGAARFER